jgi:hypothetical protein
MTTLADLSFTNLQIKRYFEGSNEYVPVSELLYVHSHPLVRPNFLAQIESLINQTAQVMVEKKTTGAPVEKFTKLAQDLGRQLPNLTTKNAPQVLETLRQIYQLCRIITGKR